jgi:hypothetical protein
VAKLPDETIIDILELQRLNLLYGSIERAKMLLDSSAASLREIQDNWSDL